MSKIKCLACGMVLESIFRHNWVSCGCENETFVDGGQDYLRCGGVDLTLIEVLKDPQEKDGVVRDCTSEASTEVIIWVEDTSVSFEDLVRQGMEVVGKAPEKFQEKEEDNEQG